jgi:hypothetical protein
LAFIFTKDVFYTVSEVFTALIKVIWVFGGKQGSGRPVNPDRTCPNIEITYYIWQVAESNLSRNLNSISFGVNQILFYSFVRLRKRSIFTRGGGLYTPRVIPYGLSMDCTQSMDSIWTIFLAGSPAIVSVHTQYGIHMDCLWNGAIHGPVHGQSIWIPYGFHGMSNEF